ncbi:MAG: L,D-transpeptidase, partial [Atopobiaceae bacterium]|nr:L,D-transpeptidase [Atopobiaceae bacterium]
GWDSSMGRYIDVDLEAQFARLFDENGEVIWETAVVTGDMVEGRSTETGVFSIYSMEQGVTLVGLDEDGDGQPDYESYVDYWMPFYGGLGLHDATWRYDFGGNLYSDNGSHGCVNLPHAKAAELYNMTFVGEKVYIHW